MKKLITVIFALLVITLPLCALAESSVSTPNISVTTTTGSATFTLKSDSPKATIYYTTDGSDPDTSSKKYSKAVKITTSCEVRAVAVENGEYSDVGYYTVTVTKARAATPTFKSTDVEGGKKITMTSSGATIYYTTDGTTPTTYSDKYTSAGVIVSQSCTIKAIAVRNGYQNSSVATALVAISRLGEPTVTKKTASNKTTYTFSGPVSGCTYYYTMDGTTPTTTTSSSCKKTTGSVTVTEAGTLRFIVAKKGYAPSKVYSFEVEGPEVVAPTPTKTAILGGYKITLKSSLSGVTMYYTTDGTTPTTLSDKYTSSGIEVTEAGTTIIRLLVTKSGYTSHQYQLTVTVPKLAKPTKPSVSSSTSSSAKLTINGPANSTIYYTTNGVDPTTSSKSVKAGGTISVTSSCTLKLMAAQKGYANSDVYSTNITINGSTSSTKVANPTVSETKYEGYNKVTLKCSTSGATIYYTLDGRDPLTYGTAVTSGTAIRVTSSCKLKAIAVKDGYKNSDTVSYNVILKGDDVTVLGISLNIDPVFAMEAGEIVANTTDSDVDETDGVIIKGDESEEYDEKDFPVVKDEEALDLKEIGGSAVREDGVVALSTDNDSEPAESSIPDVSDDYEVIML